MSKETIKIESPNLIEFVYDIERKVKEGYSVDDTNEGLPQSWGPGLYTCTVSKEVAEKPAEEPVKAEETSEETKTEEEPKPRTRRKKSASKSSKTE